MLIDRWNPKQADHMAGAINTARRVAALRHSLRRYKFSDEVTVSIARLLRDYPDLFLYNYQFGLPPYSQCYLEFNINLFQRELNSDPQNWTEGDGTDMTCAYIIDREVIHLMSEGYNHEGKLVINILPISYTMLRHIPSAGVMSHPMPAGLSPVLARTQEEIDNAIAVLLGSTLNNPRSHLTDEITNDLMRRFRMFMDLTMSKPLHEAYERGERDHVKKVMRTLFGLSMGDARTLLALLLWINQPKAVNLISAPATEGVYRKRKVNFAAHHVVHLRPEITTTRKLIRALAVRRPPRRHEVAEFWRNFDKTSGCVHDWPILPDEKGHWKCRRCPQWRTRVRHHERGSSELGFVDKEYQVEGAKA